MKKLLLLIIFVLCSCFEQSSAFSILDIYSSNSISIESISDILDESFYLYFYEPLCGYCLEVKQDINFLQAKVNIKVYIIDVMNKKEEDIPYFLGGVPQLTYIEKEEIMYCFTGVNEIKNYIN